MKLCLVGWFWLVLNCCVWLVDWVLGGVSWLKVGCGYITGVGSCLFWVVRFAGLVIIWLFVDLWILFLLVIVRHVFCLFTFVDWFLLMIWCFDFWTFCCTFMYKGWLSFVVCFWCYVCYYDLLIVWLMGVCYFYTTCLMFRSGGVLFVTAGFSVWWYDLLFYTLVRLIYLGYEFVMVWLGVFVSYLIVLLVFVYCVTFVLL